MLEHKALIFHRFPGGFGALILSVIALLVILVACTRYDHDVPDTSPNREGFERHFGFEAPPDVTELYYFADEMGVDVLYQLGFKASPETIARIVEGLGLEQSASDSISLGLAYDFPWWDEEDIERATCYWKSTLEEDYWWGLWYNPDTQRAYYIEYSL
jgi:hypothetical protein